MQETMQEPMQETTSNNPTRRYLISNLKWNETICIAQNLQHERWTDKQADEYSDYQQYKKQQANARNNKKIYDI